ncbi:MAG TPA: 5'/3'-nucleotidase SurE [Salinivirgaceae bacterium]|mgnify:CR=1 FL=1|nr:5'/3'-nucleotidase SurE [Salinivirgaceae bacterium]
MLHQNHRPLIFVSNDDGFYAGGIRALIEIVEKYGDVIAVAPESAESGMSHAITIKRPLRLKHVYSKPGVEMWKCNGTPVDCVKLGLNQVVPRKPDIMVSGINHGSNASISVIYSGTMGAAIEACLNGIPSIGFSLLDHSADANFEPSKPFVERVFSQILINKLPEYICLNVNIPNVPLEQIRGIKVCRQTHGVWKEEFEKRIDPHGGEYYWLTGNFKNFEVGNPETDEWALENNYVAVVPIHADFTAYQSLNGLRYLQHESTKTSQ